MSPITVEGYLDPYLDHINGDHTVHPALENYGI